MKTIISSRITIYDPDPGVVSWCGKNLRVRNPLYDQLMKLGKEDTIRYKHVPETMDFCKRYPDRITVPFGCLPALWPWLKEGKGGTDLAPKRPISIRNAECPLKLYDYQEDAVSAMVKAKGGILVSGCGSGKTFCGIEIIRRIGLRFLWIVGTKDLLRQAMKNFLSLYPKMDIGLITEGKFRIGRDGAISTIQTLVNVPPSDYENEFNVVVYDECHHAASDSTKARMTDKVLSHVKARYRYGLTATPYRGDSLINTMYMNLGMSPAGEFKPTYEVSRSRVHTMMAKYERLNVSTPASWDYLNTDGTFDYTGLVTYLCGRDETTVTTASGKKRKLPKVPSNRVRDEEICAGVVALCGKGRKIAVISSRVGHCADLAAKLRESGVAAIAVTGRTKGKDRKSALTDIAKWQVIVSTSALFKEGLDIKELDTVVLVAPIKDKAAVVQACGRCERYLDEKKQPLFVDVCDVNIPYCVNAAEKRRRYIQGRR